MRKPILGLLLVVSATAIAGEQEYLEEVDSEVYELPGTVAEITQKAELCIARVIQFDEARIAESSSSVYISETPGKRIDGISGGAVFVSKDIEGGTIVANSRTEYGGFLGAQTVQSTLTFRAKEGRFKITHTNIKAASKNSGYAANNGFIPVGKWPGSPWKKVTKSLSSVTEDLSSCIVAVEVEDDW